MWQSTRKHKWLWDWLALDGVATRLKVCYPLARSFTLLPYGCILSEGEVMSVFFSAPFHPDCQTQRGQKVFYCFFVLRRPWHVPSKRTFIRDYINKWLGSKRDKLSHKVRAANLLGTWMCRRRLCSIASLLQLTMFRLNVIMCERTCQWMSNWNLNQVCLKSEKIDGTYIICSLSHHWWAWNLT